MKIHRKSEKRHESPSAQACDESTLSSKRISFPLFLRALFRQPLRLGDAVAMVFLCGLCVNNALYILNESKERPPKEAVRALFKSIASSSLTTIFGALPVMIFAQDEFSKDLAFFMFWGTLATMTIGIFIFPRLLKDFEKSGS